MQQVPLSSRCSWRAFTREFVEAGGLMTYGPALADRFRYAATSVDKILKGARPSDLPMEQPIKVELVINLKTVRALGLTMPRRCFSRRTR